MTNSKKQYIIDFENGLFGFEDCKKFTPIFLDENVDTMLTLQSLDLEELSFVVMNPFVLKPDYSPKISSIELQSIGKNENNEYAWYVICVTKNPIEDSTVNLKCPIIINPLNGKAKQVILDNDDYKMRHTLKELTAKENNSC